LTVQTVWQEELEVHSHESDFANRWKPAAVLRMMEEITVHHSFHLNVDYYSLQKMSLAWVLVRYKIRFYEFPGMGTKIIAQTWPRGWQQKIFGMRDYTLTGEKGRKIAHATSAWLLVNTNTRKFVKPDTVTITIPDNEGKYVLDRQLDKLARPSGTGKTFEFNAGYSCLDLLGHVNNTRYVDWLCDCFPLSFWQRYQLQTLQINYSNEVKPHENVRVEIISDPAQPACYFASGACQSDQRIAFEAQLNFI
jgi:medium-chain acyl-[acyl-carrier-protein] hydrolase